MSNGLRADTIARRLIYLQALFVLVALPVGLLVGAATAVLVEEATIGSVVDNAIFLWLVLAVLAVPGVLLYGLILELDRRWWKIGMPLRILALPSVLIVWMSIGMPLFAGGAGGAVATSALITFGLAVIQSFSHSVI